MKTSTTRVLLLVAVVAALFGLFSLSVAIWGSWWRFSAMPAAEEWSAFFGASALVALWFAWYQIRQVDQSNKSLIASNELVRHVNIESVRPRVQVSLDIERLVGKKRGAPVRGKIYIAVQNIGVSPARDVRLKVNPPFTSLEEFFNPNMMEGHFDKINKIFNGEVHFQILNPGNKYIFLLGGTELFNAGHEIPRQWRVETHYSGTASYEPFSETFVLDLDVEMRIEAPVNPLVRIGKDIEVVGSHLEQIKTAIPRSLTVACHDVKAPGWQDRKMRPSLPRARQMPRLPHRRR